MWYHVQDVTTTKMHSSNHKGLAEDPERNYEKHKQDSLEKQRQGKGHWKAELASDSEAAVKADRAAKPESPADLQERTKWAAEEISRHGTSMRDGL
ncbi:uncharacterized protein B0I36DRAFT_257403 [Microdochium trichocladiopsis]|uniref:Uncharacterized protein n=1 Tax=Microdochium trichocladiopsis TaxID=1682393 RepID=A0A9P9BHE0_9PEZI|nr:uncharacterized protein B0I36DRAFT_257403 [Microdochium trichocladiopsis]KAH7010621.1 hypothetical protein B0I36DRAFT_257403 [Microdochium trichocladiopsis]